MTRVRGLVLQLIQLMVKLVPSRHRPEAKGALARLVGLGREAAKSVTSRSQPVLNDQVVWLRHDVADLQKSVVGGPRPSEVLVKVHSSVVSPGTERAFLIGAPNTKQTFPSGAGYSGSGTVIRAGADVHDIQPGDSVAGAISHSSVDNPPASFLAVVPPGVPLRHAAFTQLGVIALQGVRAASIRPGSKVIVVGLGVIGQLAIQLSRWAGASSVIGASRSGRFNQRAEESGCTEVIQALDGHMSGEEARVVIDASGTTSGFSTALQAVEPGGQLVSLASTRGGNLSLPVAELLGKRGVSVVGAHISRLPESQSVSGNWTRRDEAALFLRLLKEGVVRVDHLIDSVASPSEANAVYEALVDPTIPDQGVVFDWIGAGG